MTRNIGTREWWKDRALLLLSAVGAIIAITLFSIGAGQESTVVLGVIVFVSLIADNRRLRKELARRDAERCDTQVIEARNDG
ncbi:hypothetical protein LJR230_005198 [Trinickia sp. LjRoot230]|uniref:hypothetical protein n=1 Tax=Trinickia sp. LjRoot230 TaxID=3342288 RepID=UPI003ECC220D